MKKRTTHRAYMPGRELFAAAGIPVAGPVFVRGMSANERDEFEESLRGRNGRINLRRFRASMVAWLLVNKSGQRIVTGPTEIQKLGCLRHGVLDEIIALGIELSS